MVKKIVSFAVTHPTLANEWHPTKNGELTPEEITHGSHQLVWWQCTLGHEWEQAICYRNNKSKCHVCSNRLLLTGFNDLATTHPDLAAQWHPTKNGSLLPSQVMTGSGKKVWWLGECGHEWEAIVADRVRRDGCPYCSNHRLLVGFNDLASQYPYLAAEWHPTKNGETEPGAILASCLFVAQWICKEGHEWSASIRDRKRGNTCPTCRGAKIHVGFNDFMSTHPKLAAQWHPTLNGALTPQTVMKTSPQRVWWLGECGHEWQAKVTSFIRSSICPYCNGHKILVGFNDLATTHPDLAIQWHPTKNGSLTPKNVSFGSHEKVWWLGECGHEWTTAVHKRAIKDKPFNCPVCSGQLVLPGFNDFATVNPQLAAQWHPTKNDDLTPVSVSRGSNRRVWWLGECGHEWQAKIAVRASGTGCPYCRGLKILVGFNDLATTHPDLAAQWHPTKNGNLTPKGTSFGSHRTVWWLGKCGHEWETTMSYIVKGRCSICAGRRIEIGFNDLSTTHPDIAVEWHPTKNDDLTPQMVSRGSRGKVWWQCPQDHEWSAKIADRTRSGSKATGCPTCAAQSYVSRGEQGIADYLSQELGLTIEQSNRSLLKGIELDIYVPEKKLAIEHNGIYWHSSARRKNDRRHREKYEQARAAGIQLLQVWEDEWRDKPELVKRLLAHKLGESREPLVGARQTRVEAIPLAEARIFLNKYHIQGHANGSYYLGLCSQKTNQLVALMVLVKRANPNGFTLEIVRYATSCRVPGGFTKLLKHVETILNPSRLVTFADHCISDGGLYENNGFTAEKELKPDYRYFVNRRRAHKFGYRLERFKSDPNLLWEPNLTETKLAQLNGLHRIFDAGKTRWVKTFPVS